MARNHTDKGVRVSWKIVPAVTEVWYPHPAHSLRLRTGHAFPDPQWAQRKPVGQRSRAKYARHASSVLKFASNSVRLRGYSSTISAHYILGLPESSGYPPPTIIEPLQQFPVAVGVIGRHPHRSPAVSFVVAIDHVSCRRTLLTQTGGRRLHPHDHTAFIVDQIVIEVTQFGSAISLGQVRRIRVGGRHLVLLMGWLAIAVLLL